MMYLQNEKLTIFPTPQIKRHFVFIKFASATEKKTMPKRKSFRVNLHTFAGLYNVKSTSSIFAILFIFEEKTTTGMGKVMPVEKKNKMPQYERKEDRNHSSNNI